MEEQEEELAAQEEERRKQEELENQLDPNLFRDPATGELYDPVKKFGSI